MCEKKKKTPGRPVDDEQEINEMRVFEYYITLTRQERGFLSVPVNTNLAHIFIPNSLPPSACRHFPRELANQIFGVVSKFADLLDEAKPLLLVGGTSVEDCLAAFRKGGASILVGTPGRIEDMLNNYSVFDVKGESDRGGYRPFVVARLTSF